MPSRMHSRLKQLGEFRDSFLVIAGSIYVLGYIVRSVNALRNNLGLLPAFESQYFIAGIVPALFLVFLYLIVWCLWQFKKRLPIWLNSGKYKVIIFFLLFVSLLVAAVMTPAAVARASEINLVIVSIIGLMSLYLLFSFFAINKDDVQKAWNNLRNSDFPWYLRLVRLLVFLIIAILYSPIFIIDKFILGIGRIINEMIDLFTLITVLIILLYAVIGLDFFVSDIYPKIPQELGGVQPRCAYVDVINSEISSDLRGAIFSSNSANIDIVRSIQLDVYFSNNELMLVKPHSKTLPREDITYEIQKSVIRAVTWCK